VRFDEGETPDFSCGLGFIPKGKTQVFSLRRYNGKSHQHTNRLDENQPFYDFHIHQATGQRDTRTLLTRIITMRLLFPV